MTVPLLPEAIIGIVGGGQLGRMSAIAAAQLGYHVHILSDIPHPPASEVAQKLTVGAYDDPDILNTFARNCTVISFEFENISANGLKQLEAVCPVYPAGRILEISQNRVAEKTFLKAQGFPLAPWQIVEKPSDLEQLVSLGFPLILKTARYGYDGKGQYRLSSHAMIKKLDQTNLAYPLVAERQINFMRELSVMVVRNTSGVCHCFEPSENIHRDGILKVSCVPASIMPDVAAEAQHLARELAEKMNLVGIMGVEFFHDSNGHLLINEIAPRPHNSGHWTIDACPVDQFEMHIRAIAGLPLPTPERHSDAFMHNLIGPEDMALLPALLAEDGACVHLYGKKEARSGRKMGHVTRLFPRGGLPGRLALEELTPPLS